MKIIIIPVGMISENVYIYYDENSLDGIIIDPGFESKQISQAIEENNINIKAILLTHGHFDHIGGANSIKAQTGSKIYASKEESLLLSNSDLNLSKTMHRNIELKADIYFEDGYEVNMDNIALKVIHTPGHTPGSVCFYSKEDKVLFSGDTLFLESVGRTDFPLSDTESILGSLNEKLMTLPDDTIVYPGHGDPTTIGHERLHNPYLDKDGRI